MSCELLATSREPEENGYDNETSTNIEIRGPVHVCPLL
jgi:hypothetical protein